MKLAGLPVVLFLLAIVPASAQDAAEHQDRGGVVGWLLSPFGDTAPSSPDDGASKGAGAQAGNPHSAPPADASPIDMSAAVQADRDTYKPDAGDAEH